MFARTTQLEIDSVRIAVQDAVELFEREVMPGLRDQPGYLGVIVLTTMDGKAMLVSFWETEEQARTESPFYESELTKFVALFRSAPGREAYEVALLDGAVLRR